MWKAVRMSAIETTRATVRGLDDREVLAGLLEAGRMCATQYVRRVMALAAQ
jgi:hypothetical protein